MLSRESWQDGPDAAEWRADGGHQDSGTGWPRPQVTIRFDLSAFRESMRQLGDALATFTESCAPRGSVADSAGTGSGATS